MIECENSKNGSIYNVLVLILEKYQILMIFGFVKNVVVKMKMKIKIKNQKSPKRIKNSQLIKYFSEI